MTQPTEAEAVRRAIDELGEAGRLIADEVRQDRVQRRKNDRIVVALLIIVMVAVAAATAVAYQNGRLNAQIADCTTPGGGCYENNRTQAALNRAALTRANLIIVSCARSTRTDDELSRCVLAKMLAAGDGLPMIPIPGLTGPPTSAPTGPPAGTTIEPPDSDQPHEPGPAQPPSTQDPASAPATTGGV